MYEIPAADMPLSSWRVILTKASSGWQEPLQTSVIWFIFYLPADTTANQTQRLRGPTDVFWRCNVSSRWKFSRDYTQLTPGSGISARLRCTIDLSPIRGHSA